MRCTPKPGRHVEPVSNSQYIHQKFPKVGNSALPEDWKSPEPTYREINTYHENKVGPTAILHTTLPEQFIDGPDHPDGHTECLVRGNFKEKILRTPGYLQPIPKVLPDTFVIRPISENEAGWGLGAFAGRDIKIGDLIVAERPLLIVPSEMGVTSSEPVQEHYTQAMINDILLREWEKQLKVPVDRMSDENKKAFYALANSHTNDGSGVVSGITRTNGYELDIGELSGEKPKTGTATTSSTYGVVGKDASRINHSCSPNVTQTFSLRTFSLQIRALKAMKAGEQFLYAYYGTTLPSRIRIEKLESYGFTCSCSACVNATPETERLRMTYSDKIERFQKLCERVYLNLRFKLTEAVLEPMLKLRERMRAEGLDGTKDYLVSSTMVHRLYIALGLQAKAKELGVEEEVKGWQRIKIGEIS